ncbi:transcription factor Opi1-domain-containing protein [Cladochytrium replicatum]|nr:transcription factor Opi1-domain-containing protein [Cladochytrium replicatum]
MTLANASAGCAPTAQLSLELPPPLVQTISDHSAIRYSSGYCSPPSSTTPTTPTHAILSSSTFPTTTSSSASSSSSSAISINRLCNSVDLPTDFLDPDDIDVQIAAVALGGLKYSSDPNFHHAFFNNNGNDYIPIENVPHDCTLPEQHVLEHNAHKQHQQYVAPPKQQLPPLEHVVERQLDQPQQQQQQHHHHHHQQQQQQYQHFIQRVSNIPMINRGISTLSTAYEATKATNRVIKMSAETVETGVKNISTSVLDRLDPLLAPVDRFACSQLDRLERSFPSFMQQQQQQQPQQRMIENHLTPSPSQTPPHEQPPLPHPRPLLPNSVVSPAAAAAAVAQPTTAPVINRKPTPARTTWQLLPRTLLADETARALRYCVQFLTHAYAHLDHQITLLRSYISTTSASEVAASVRREVVETLRRVVDVVGRYAAVCLPREARRRVRRFVLGLPERVGVAAGGGAGTGLLELAEESREMVGRVGSVFKQTERVFGVSGDGVGEGVVEMEGVEEKEEGVADEEELEGGQMEVDG